MPCSQSLGTLEHIQKVFIRKLVADSELEVLEVWLFLQSSLSPDQTFPFSHCPWLSRHLCVLSG